MPLPLIPLAASGAGVLVRQLVRYAWGPLVTGIGHLMKSRLGLFIASAFLWLGINFTTIKLVIEPSINVLRGMTEQISSGGASEFAAVAGGYAGVMMLDRAVTMVISAVVTKHAVMQGRLFLFKRGVGA